MRDRDDRHLRLVADIADVPSEKAADKFQRARVAIAWPPDIEESPLGPLLIETTAVLIARFCPKIHLVGEDAVTSQVLGALHALDSTSDAEFRSGPLGEATDVAIWLGGGDPGSYSATTSASANGWLSYIASDGAELPKLSGGRNPMGALAAAALTATEAFKTLLPPRKGRGHLFEATAYSTYSYRISADPGPELPEVMTISGRPLLAGVGAVGQAFLHVLGKIPGLAGDLTLVDRELVDDPTNMNRYYGVRERHLRDRAPKTDVGEELLAKSQVNIHKEQRELLEVLGDINKGSLPRPELVISALDHNDPRYALQLLWPDVVLEGATGDTLLQLFRHSHAEGTACLRCIHPPANSDVAYETAASRRSGLQAERVLQGLQGGSAVVEERDVDAAPEAKKEFLRSRLGRDLCGVLAEAERFETSDSQPVQPSVSFTSYLSGLLVAGEFVRHVAGLPPGLSGRYQLDPIATLSPEPPWTERKRRDCYCVERARTVELYREMLDPRQSGGTRAGE